MYDETLVPHIIEACKYGLLKGSQGNFMPENNLTQAQGLTVVMRSLHGIQDETAALWYQAYYDLGIKDGIISAQNINTMDSTKLTRELLGTWFYKAAHLEKDMMNEKDTMKAKEIMDAEQGKESMNDNISGYLAYDDAKVAQALSQGQHVVLYFHADRCPTCKALDSNLAPMTTDRPSTLAVFKIDYDNATELKSTYGITRQHTLIKLDASGEEVKRNTTAITFEDVWKNLVEGIKI